MVDRLPPETMLHRTMRSCIEYPYSRDTMCKVLFFPFWLFNNNSRHESMSIWTWKYEDYAPEWCNTTMLGVSEPWLVVTILGANNAFQPPTWVKANLVELKILRLLELYLIEARRTFHLIFKCGLDGWSILM